MNVTASRVDDIDDQPRLAGAFALLKAYGGGESLVGIEFVCPCGCGRPGYLPLNGSGAPGPSWDWDGNEERPTLQPSIKQVGGCEWHGWLIEGVWKSC